MKAPAVQALFWAGRGGWGKWTGQAFRAEIRRKEEALITNSQGGGKDWCVNLLAFSLKLTLNSIPRGKRREKALPRTEYWRTEKDGKNGKILRLTVRHSRY